MPVYEYRCEVCDERFELFVRSPLGEPAPTCPKCGSREVEKAISLFGVGGGRSRTSGVSCSSGPT